MNTHEQRNRHEERAVDERSQDLGPVEAKSSPLGMGFFRDPHGEHTKAESRRVRDHVSGVCDQSQTVRDESADELRKHEEGSKGEGEHHRPMRPLRPNRPMIVLRLRASVRLLHLAAAERSIASNACSSP